MQKLNDLIRSLGGAIDVIAIASIVSGDAQLEALRKQEIATEATVVQIISSDHLLAYSCAGRGDVNVDLVDAKALIGELALLASPFEGFSIASSPTAPTLRTARTLLTQALSNLIGHAIRSAEARLSASKSCRRLKCRPLTNGFCRGWIHSGTNNEIADE
ncbi:MAG: hypothetical protein WDN46_11115 [Methylocella sp.]